RLARFFFDADPVGAPALAVAAFGLQATNHWGVLAQDADDPVSTSTPWADAPGALVPVLLRERGDTTNRGRTTPMRDRRTEQRALRRRREQELEALRRVDTELLTSRELHGRMVSAAALARLEQALARAMQQLGVRNVEQSCVDGAIR